MNQVYPVQARVRLTQEMIVVEDLLKASLDPSLYIQNKTFVDLLLEMKNHFKGSPKRILDMAAAPGGKLILIHDLYPQSLLFANDIETKKLKENLQKYQVEAEVTTQPAELYETTEKFDLIICDVPCSNSGVLGKRPEARWRLSEENVDAHQQKQLKFLKHAKSLLKKGGQIWYMTCSILKEENEEVCERSGLKVQFQKTHLPNALGDDGGFGAILTT